MTARRVDRGFRRAVPIVPLHPKARGWSPRDQVEFHLDATRAQHTAHLVKTVRPGGHTRAPLPRQQPPTPVEREYVAAIKKLIIDPLRRFLQPLFDELPRLMNTANATRASALRADAGEGRRVRELVDQARANLSDAVTPSDLERLARDMASRTAAANKVQLAHQIKSALGTDVFAADRALKPLTEAFVDANVGLIKNIGDKLASDIETTTMSAIQDGKLHGDLATELEARFGMAEDRAALIARDQIGKAYGQINAARQREIGVTSFIWRTVEDERVRQEHEDRDGETYTYDDPPDGELPGEPINCRCYAEPVFDDIFAELDA